MFMLYWREHRTHEWVWEGQFPSTLRLVKYVANDIHGWSGMFKGVAEFEGRPDVEFFKLDLTNKEV